jgi:hypothetical protein
MAGTVRFPVLLLCSNNAAHNRRATGGRYLKGFARKVLSTSACNLFLSFQ